MSQPQSVQRRALDPALWFVAQRSSPEDLLREYRRLDDTITMRLNRSNAQIRDRDRQGLSGKGSVQDRACAYIWKELVGELFGPVSHSRGVIWLTCVIVSENWKRRTEIVDYCVHVVDQSMSEKHKVLDEREGDAKAKRKTQAELFADEVKVRSKHFHYRQ